MSYCSRFGMLCAVVLAAFASIGSAGATSANTDLSDIWWNPNEAGWGMQVVNTGTFAYVTIYGYEIDGKPTWAGGGMDKTGDDPVTYAGKLYVATGPYFGGPFDPAAVNVRQVGALTFVLKSVNAGQLTYSVDGVVINTPVQRQPLKLDDYSGTYRAIATITNTGCGAQDGDYTNSVLIDITQNGQSMSQIWAYPDGTVCTHSGTYSQVGRMGRFVSDYSCTSKESGTATMFEMNNVPYMFTARLNNPGTGNGCASVGEIIGMIPR